MANIKVRKTKQVLDGVPIVDPVMPMVVKVTANDVKKGKRGDATACPIVLAIVRQYKAKSARVNLARTYIHFEDQVRRFNTSAVMRTDVILIDHGLQPKPKEYLLRPLSEAQRHSGDYGSRMRETGRGPKRAYHMVEGVRKPAPRGGGSSGAPHG